MDLEKLALKNFVEINTRQKILPFQTIQSMAERWGISRQLVYRWSTEYNDFPKALGGVIEQTSKTPKVYPFYAVEKYEKLKGLGKHE